MKLKDIMLDYMITHLVQLCKRELGISELPRIVLVDKPTVGSGTSFGEFDGSIRVVSQGRHPMDIARTLAHELVHWQQHQAGDKLDGSDGSDTEDEANAVAGEIMRKFGRMYPEYFIQSIK